MVAIVSPRLGLDLGALSIPTAAFGCPEWPTQSTIDKSRIFGYENGHEACGLIRLGSRHAPCRQYNGAIQQ